MICTTRCLWYPKDFYLKAIPNGNGWWNCPFSDVCDIPKTFIWKQFPTRLGDGRHGYEMFVISQRLLFESNSQHTSAWRERVWRCLWYPKDFYLKAIPNAAWATARCIGDVCDIPKTFIWKQFPTGGFVGLNAGEMFVISQRLLFESNSQHVWPAVYPSGGCLWYPKDFYLKAIPNCARGRNYPLFDVCDIPKTFIWKQFPTGRVRAVGLPPMFVILLLY